jgi:peptide/nickel transport system ATP-binding protein
MISHNLAVVSHVADRVAVMYLGRVVETAPREALFFNAQHPYTQALLSAVPEPVPGRRRARQVPQGDVPSPARPPSGCHFHPRCPRAIARCAEEAPESRIIAPGHAVACHLVTP